MIDLTSLSHFIIACVAVYTAITAARTHKEVKTKNGKSIAQLSEEAESRRITKDS